MIEYTYTKSPSTGFISTITINNCTFEFALLGPPTNNPYIYFHKLEPYLPPSLDAWNWRYKENIDELVQAIILARLDGVL